MPEGAQQESPLPLLQTAPPEESLNVEILIADYPKVAILGDRVGISWKILSDFTVNITNTAIQYGYTSIPGSFGVSDTPWDVGYPFATEELAPGRLIPGSFFVRIVPRQRGPLFFRAHVLVDGKNFWTREYKIEVRQKPSIRFVDTPVKALSGEKFAVIWEIETPFKPISFSTRVYYGAEARRGSFTLDVSPPAGYPSNTEAYSRLENELTNSFQAIITPTGEGPLYLRAYAEIDGKNYWSDEREVVVKKNPEVVLLSYPEEGNASSLYIFKWRVVGGEPGIIEETGILWGPEKGQKKGDYTFTGTLQKGSTPKNFQDSFYVGYGGVRVYFRVYAVVDGAYYYSEEHSIETS